MIKLKDLLREIDKQIDEGFGSAELMNEKVANEENAETKPWFKILQIL